MKSGESRETRCLEPPPSKKKKSSDFDLTPFRFSEESTQSLANVDDDHSISYCAKQSGAWLSDAHLSVGANVYQGYVYDTTHRDDMLSAAFYCNSYGHALTMR